MQGQIGKCKGVGQKQEIIQNERCTTSGRHDLKSRFEWHRQERGLERTVNIKGRKPII